MLRAWASNRAMVCSAAERMFETGALTTMTPIRSPGDITLSSQMSARPTTTRSFAASRVGASTLVAERMITACAPTTASSSSAGDSPMRTSTSCPASRNLSRPDSAMGSVTSTRATRLPFSRNTQIRAARRSACRDQFAETRESLFELVVAKRVVNRSSPARRRPPRAPPRSLRSRRRPRRFETVKIAVMPGEAFGAPGYFRFSYALSDDELEEGLARFSELVAGGSTRGPNLGVSAER